VPSTTTYRGAIPAERSEAIKHSHQEQPSSTH
jgi:hypothetical protein